LAVDGKYQLTLLYAPDSKELQKLADAVTQSFKQKDVTASAKPASASGIPDILASDVILFGLAGQDIDPKKTDFAEMFRAFRGINLAGKFAGLLVIDDNDSPAIFRDALKDTDIDIFTEELPVSSTDFKRARIRSWARKLHHWVKDLTVESLL
jgi:hypothetical protein